MVLAVDIGGTTIKAEIVDPALDAVRRADVPTPVPRPGPTTEAAGSGPAIVDAVIGASRDLLGDSAAEQRSRVRAAGVAVPGLVDAERGIARFSANLGWRDLPLAGPLRTGLGLPVVIGHDVRLAGEAEWRRGAGRGCDHLLVIVIGTGIAATVVSGGRTISGAAGQIAELGHVVVSPDGPRCGCGARGCLETIASATAIAREYARRTGGEVAGAADVVALLHTDPAAAAVWQEAVDALADGIRTAVAMFTPNRIVIGGGLALAGEALLEPLRRAVKVRAEVFGVPPIVGAAFGARAGLVGAALAAQQAAARAGSADG
ncbi:MAG: ROK family protein [Propionibacteriales bacterium]|nr:ROK family protein [Propionibacteriales bacterium]